MYGVCLNNIYIVYAPCGYMESRLLRMPNPRLEKLKRLEWIETYKAQANPDDKTFLSVIMKRFKVSRKTAQEYIATIE